MENVSAEVQAAEAQYLASLETGPPVPEEVEAFLFQYYMDQLRETDAVIAEARAMCRARKQQETKTEEREDVSLK
jgi:hypothetical protein